MSGEVQLEDDAKLVVRLRDHAQDLTDWEGEFVESICERVLDHHRELTGKQRKIADRIDADKVA